MTGTTMVPRFLKPVFCKKIRFAFLICLGIGFSNSLFVAHPPGAPQRAIEAWKARQACLGSLLWFEARGEPLKAQQGVLEVALNRELYYGLPVCDVLRAKGQFQWTKHNDPTVVDEKRAALLHSARKEPKVLEVEKSQRPYLWFYSLPHPPKWAHNMKCRLIGKTTFCKEKK